MSVLPGLRIRNLSVDDYLKVAEVDRAVSGEFKPEYWKRKLEIYTSNPELCFGAEYQGEFIGFLIGYIKGGEFGIREEKGWLEIIGVKPEYQHKGVATALTKALVKAFELYGIDTIYILINWNDTDMVGFLDKFGFKRGNLTSLEKKI